MIDELRVVIFTFTQFVVVYDDVNGSWFVYHREVFYIAFITFI